MDLSTGIMLINYGHKSVMFLLQYAPTSLPLVYEWLEIELKWVVCVTGLVANAIEDI